MKTIIKRVRHVLIDEGGKVLILTLILLVIGGLILAPLLGLMSTGLIAGQVYEKNTAELYAADAGIENGIWHLQQGGSPDDVLEFTLNGKDVTVTMNQIVPGQCHEPAIYEITSTATGGDGPGTTVEAHVTNIYRYVESGYLEQGEIIWSGVYAPGDLYLSNEAEIHGNVIVEGDLYLNSVSLIGGFVCVGGHLTLNSAANITGDVFVRDSLWMQGGQEGGSWIGGNVYVMGRETRVVSGEDAPFVLLMTGQSEIKNDLWAGNPDIEEIEGLVRVDRWATIIGKAHVNDKRIVSAHGETYENIYGGVHEDYEPHGCPLGFAPPEILLWLIV